MITSAEGYYDCGGAWIILFESDRDGGGGSVSLANHRTCSYRC